MTADAPNELARYGEADVDGWRRISRMWERRAKASGARLDRLRSTLKQVVDQLDEVADTLDELEREIRHQNPQQKERR